MAKLIKLKNGLTNGSHRDGQDVVINSFNFDGPRGADGWRWETYLYLGKKLSFYFV
jgi:hypothetical protein